MNEYEEQQIEFLIGDIDMLIGDIDDKINQIKKIIIVSKE